MIFILVIVEMNYMTQIKEKTGICKSVVIATVVAIRDVVKNGFHCIEIMRGITLEPSTIAAVLLLLSYLIKGNLYMEQGSIVVSIIFIYEIKQIFNS